MTERRNLLIIASQCDSMGKPLEKLAVAVDELRAALLDPAVGGCRPGLSTGESAVLGVGSEQFRALVADAVQLATRQDACLVLAVLGHGKKFSGRVHFMARDSTDEINAVDLPAIVNIAAQKVHGTVVIADICMAAGSAPSSGQLLGGLRKGRLRLSMLMSASAGQSAYDLDYTRTLARVLSEGVPDAGETLTPSFVNKMIAKRLDRQDPVAFSWDGDAYGDELWISRNRVSARMAPWRFTTYARDLLRARLADACELKIDSADSWAATLAWAQSELIRVQQDTGRDVTRQREAVSEIAFAYEAADFVRGWLPESLTTKMIRACSADIPVPVPDVMSDSLEGTLLHIATHYGHRDGGSRAAVARFVARLGIAAKRDPNDQKLMEWSRRHQCVEHVNDARHDLAAAERRLRLVVGLHGSIGGDWPDDLEAWLYCDAKLVRKYQQPCADRTRTATETAIRAIIERSERDAEKRGAELHAIEIAAPEQILLVWRPERLTYGEVLCANFEVSTRWSGRMKPAENSGLSHAIIRKRLRLIQAETAEGRTPIDWLNTAETEDHAALQISLTDGKLKQAIALTHRPPSAEILHALMAHTPALLWPDESELDADARDRVEARWRQLFGCPATLPDREPVDPGTRAVEIRMVQDDEFWLNFCARFSKLWQRGGKGT